MASAPGAESFFLDLMRYLVRLLLVVSRNQYFEQWLLNCYYFFQDLIILIFE